MASSIPLFDESVGPSAREVCTAGLAACETSAGSAIRFFVVGHSTAADRGFDEACERRRSGERIFALHRDVRNATRDDLSRLAAADAFLFEPFSAGDVAERVSRPTAGAPTRDRWHTERVAMIGHLTGGIAHDFNNLLTIIVSYTSMVLDSLPPGTARDDLQEVRNAARRATELSRRLLDFTRVRNEQDAPTTDANAVVQGVEKLLRRLLPDRITINVLLRGDVGAVALSPVDLEQVLVNLALNAADAMPDGGALAIETRRQPTPRDVGSLPEFGAEQDAVEISVTDAGIGIDAETLPRIFEPFYTTKARGKGTGLGLASAYGIVTNAGGSLQVESTVAVGTTFRLRLPRVAATNDGPRRPSSHAALASIGGETILLVEKDDAVRTTLKVVLFRAGYRVIDASSAGDALLAAEQHTGSIALLLSDAKLPRVSGPNLHARLARTRPAIRALFLVGSGAEAGSDDDVLTKPIVPGELLRRVRAALAPPRR